LEAAKSGAQSEKRKKFDKALKALQAFYPKFFYKQKVIEDLVVLVDDNNRAITNIQKELARSGKWFPRCDSRDTFF
jgi:hypothetical protein